MPCFFLSFPLISAIWPSSSWKLNTIWSENLAEKIHMSGIGLEKGKKLLLEME